MHNVLLSTCLLFLIAVSGFVGCADTATNPVTADSTAASAPGANNGGEISADQAVQIALAQVAGKVVETEREMEGGVDMYGIEIETDAGVVKEVEIDVNTGEVLNIEDDDDGDDKVLGIF